jgi:hypothetical protein
MVLIAHQQEGLCTGAEVLDSLRSQATPHLAPPPNEKSEAWAGQRLSQSSVVEAQERSRDSHLNCGLLPFF